MSHVTTQLSAKHWKALELIEEGSVSLKDIAKTIGWGEDTMYALCAGRVDKVGEVGALFHSELQKITERHAARIKTLTKDNKVLALAKINEYLRSLSKKKPDAEMVKEINGILNALAKSTPGVEIGQFSYTKGLSAEDLVSEFKRLSAVARATLDGKRI